MLKLLFLLLLFSIQILSQCDSLNKKQDEVFQCLWGVRMPELIGGLDGLQQKLIYPKAALENHIEGKIIVFVRVDTFGNVICSEIFAGKSFGYGCDEEAIRLASSAKFRPAFFRNKYINAVMGIPIQFKLPED